jgi:hypothetical protein
LLTRFTLPALVIMILWSGGQYDHCIQTLGFAIKEFADIKGRLLELRASCYMALRNFKVCLYTLHPDVE